MTPGASSSSRGEKRTEPQQNVFAKKRVMMKSPKRLATTITPSDDPVMRRLMKNTDTKGDDVLMPVEITDSDLLHTVNALLNDETGEDAWCDESEKTKILSVLDDHKVNDEGTSEGAEFTEINGCHDSCERSEAAGKRVIQTRRVDREKDGRVKSRLVLKDFNRSQERTQPEMFSPTPSTL